MEAYKLDSKKRCVRKDVQAMIEQLSSILEQFPLLQKDLQLSEELLRTSASIQSILSQSNHLEETHSSTLGRLTDFSKFLTYASLSCGREDDRVIFKTCKQYRDSLKTKLDASASRCTGRKRKAVIQPVADGSDEEAGGAPKLQKQETALNELIPGVGSDDDETDGMEETMVHDDVLFKRIPERALVSKPKEDSEILILTIPHKSSPPTILFGLTGFLEACIADCMPQRAFVINCITRFIFQNTRRKHLNPYILTLDSMDSDSLAEVGVSPSKLAETKAYMSTFASFDDLTAVSNLLAEHEMVAHSSTRPVLDSLKQEHGC